jgi:hypothetical protein
MHEKLDDFGGQIPPVELQKTIDQPFAGRKERLVWPMGEGKGNGRSGAMDRFHSDLIGISKVAPRERPVFRLHGHFAQQVVCGDVVAAAFQQPAQLIAGDLVFACGDHRFDLAKVVLALQGTARVL